MSEYFALGLFLRNSLEEVSFYTYLIITSLSLCHFESGAIDKC